LPAEALGLEPQPVLTELLGYPFGIIRLAAYWDWMDLAPGQLHTAWLD